MVVFWMIWFINRADVSMPCVKNNISLLSVLTAILLLVTSVPSAASVCTQDTASHIKKMPSLPDGATLNLTFKSRIDGSLQSLLVKVPKGYTPQKSWPLLVTLHGLGDGPIIATEVDSMVQIGPYGRGSVWYTGIGQADVFENIEMAKKLFSIDENRLYLCGFSMGAVATFDLGLKYPDMWAACVPVCGRCNDLDLVENGRHLPFWINTGELDTLLPARYSLKPYKKALELEYLGWKYSEYENMAHSFNIDWKLVENWLSTKRKTGNPKHVSFCTKDLGSNRAYWVEITDIKQYGSNARLDALINGQKINIVTENVANYTLRLNANLVDLAKEITIVENGVSIFCGILNKVGRFIKLNRGPDAVFKRPGLCGPLWDIYSSSCILVYGTNSEDDSLVKAAKRCAESFSNPGWMDKVDFRVLADVDVKSNDLQKNNLVLFGNADTNKSLANISEKLPVQMSGDCIEVKSVKYSGKNIGYVLIYPNPTNSNKYVAVFSGNTVDAINCFESIWPQLNSVPKDIDFGIFELTTESAAVKWRLKEVFNSNWDWQ